MENCGRFFFYNNIYFSTKNQKSTFHFLSQAITKSVLLLLFFIKRCIMNSHYYLVGFSALITLNVRPLPDPFSMFAVFIPFNFSVSQGSGFCP